jgi:DUF1680 family protein
MERRKFITGMSVALLGTGYLSEVSKAQVDGNSSATTQPLGLPVKASQPRKTFGRYALLSVGTIRPEGWLRQYAQINADSWLLMYARNRDKEVYNQYCDRREVRDQGSFVDYPGDFGADLVHYASMLPNAQVAVEVEPWIKSVLECQDADGYLGGFAPEARWRNWLETWTLAYVLDALLMHYEVTGDKSLLIACERAVGVVMQVVRNSSNESPGPDFHNGLRGSHDDSGFGPIAKGDLYAFVTFGNAGILLARPIGKLSMLTGNESYLNFARDYLYKFGKVQAYLSGGDPVIYNHAVIEITNVGAPAYLYEYSGDPQMLQASQAGWEMARSYLSVAGSPQGGEFLTGVGARANSEHCDAIMWIEASGVLARMTGEVKYADAVERVMFNDYPAPKSPDGWSLGYMHTPNQLVATEWCQPTINNFRDLDMAGKSRHYYSTSHSPLCCNVNSPRGIPLFVESMVVGAKDGLSFLYYGPCTVSTSLPQAGALGISVDTQYPFEDEVRITLRPERAAVFPVQLRVPGWCVAASIEVNGAKYEGQVDPGTFAVISRKWESGDRVVVKFVNGVRLVWGPKPEAGVRVQCAAVERGPLVYALRVPEQWLPFKAPDHGPGKEEDIKSYRLLPENNAAWNYALMVDRDHLERDLELKQLEVPKDARPWDGSSPIGLSVKARRVLNWQMEGDPEHPMTPGFPFNPMKLSEQIETVTLLPFGTTRLRMTFLPIVVA